MASPLFSIVIPTRTPGLLLDCLVRLERAGTPGNYEVIVVDTGEGVCLDLAEQSDATAISLPGATFAEAVNAGARIVHSDLLLLLNDDVRLPAGLFGFWQSQRYDSDESIIGARLLYPDGLIQHAGVGFDIDGNPYHLWHGAPGEHPEAMQVRWLPAVTFACAIVSRQMWDELGGLDEGYRNGYEDVDFCLRAREVGYQVMYDPNVTATHLTAQTPGRFDNEAANKQRFIEKWVLSGRLSYVLGSFPFSVGR